jgi:hypothetical protein
LDCFEVGPTLSVNTADLAEWIPDFVLGIPVHDRSCIVEVTNFSAYKRPGLGECFAKFVNRISRTTGSSEPGLGPRK